MGAQIVRLLPDSAQTERLNVQIVRLGLGNKSFFSGINFEFIMSQLACTMVLLPKMATMKCIIFFTATLALLVNVHAQIEPFGETSTLNRDWHTGEKIQ
jgi:hypothetical protein